MSETDTSPDGLPLYLQSAQVSAFKIGRIEKNGDASFTLYESEDPAGEGCAIKVDAAYIDRTNVQVGEYFVRRDDGYRFSLTASSFESQFVAIGAEEPEGIPLDEWPEPNHKKADIEAWLKGHNVDTSEAKTKAELLALVDQVPASGG